MSGWKYVWTDFCSALEYNITKFMAADLIKFFFKHVYTHTHTQNTYYTVKNTNTSLLGWIKKGWWLGCWDMHYGACSTLSCWYVRTNTQTDAHIGYTYTIACWAAPPRLWQTITITDTVRVHQQLDFDSHNTHKITTKTSNYYKETQQLPRDGKSLHEDAKWL